MSFSSEIYDESRGLIKLRFSYVFASLVFLFGCSYQNNNEFDRNSVSNSDQSSSRTFQKSEKLEKQWSKRFRLEIPEVNFEDAIVEHEGYSILYDETHEQASWVAYELTSAETQKLFQRTNIFLVDNEIKSGSSNSSDFYGSGFDRGHLAPAADMGWSKAAMKESFYYSNISPQRPGFNRGIWKSLEKLTRSWAAKYGRIYVVTGPVLRADLPSIGPNEVSVPNYYYKVILKYNAEAKDGIGFVIPNKKAKQNLKHFAISINNIEKITGINFFPKLNEIEEKSIEEKVCLDCWHWENNFTNRPNKKKISNSVQCSGITRKGNRCRNKTLSADGYCYHHNGRNNYDGLKSRKKNYSENKTPAGVSAVQCSGITQKGIQCRRITSNNSGRCWQH